MTSSRVLVAVAATLAALALAACADDDQAPEAAPTASPPPTATAAPGSTPPPGAGRSSASPAGDATSRTPISPRSPAPAPPAPAPRGPTLSGGADDRTGDLVRGRRTITGTVERTGGWLLLRTSDSTWALLGQRAETLRPGTSVTVTGVVTDPPAGCPTERGLSVYGTR